MIVARLIKKHTKKYSFCKNCMFLSQHMSLHRLRMKMNGNFLFQTSASPLSHIYIHETRASQLMRTTRPNNKQLNSCLIFCVASNSRVLLIRKEVEEKFKCRYSIFIRNESNSIRGLEISQFSFYFIPQQT
jgi:hypothetical protein